MRSPAVSNASTAVMRHEFSGRVGHAMMPLMKSRPTGGIAAWTLALAAAALATGGWPAPAAAAPPSGPRPAGRGRGGPGPGRTAARGDGRLGRGGRRQDPAARLLAGRPPGQPGLADEAGDDLCRPRAARPGLQLVDPGLAAGTGGRRRAAGQPGDQGPRRSEAGAGADLAAAAPGAAGGRARDPRRHRGRPQRLRAGRDQSGRFRRRAAAPLQRRRRRAAAQLPLGPADDHARPGARRSPTIAVDPPLAGVRADATRAAARRTRATTGAARSRATSPTRPGSPCAAPTRRPAARRSGRSPMPTRAATTSAPCSACGRSSAAGSAAASARAPRRTRRRASSCARRPCRDRARHQQAQQQRDGAAALPDARRDPARRRHAGGGARGAAAVAARARRRAPRASVIANGSGLSRDCRLTAPHLGTLLQSAWAEPGDVRADELAAGGGHRRHAAPLQGRARAAPT